MPHVQAAADIEGLGRVCSRFFVLFDNVCGVLCVVWCVQRREVSVIIAAADVTVVTV